MIPLLAASEKGRGQTESPLETTAEMWWRQVTKSMSQSFLERNTLEGDSPVDQIDTSLFERVGLPGLEVWIWQD